jgi:hypothetical protein
MQLVKELMEATETTKLKPRMLPAGSVGTDSRESLDTAKNWLITCSWSHAECIKSTREPVELPARFLEINLDQVEPVKRIRLRTDVQVVKYATLSYCWGGVASHVPHLRKENLTSYMQEIVVGDLPKTFRDAIECAYRLGVRYLWIDSLCIIQDSEEDWLRQSALMADIYARSFINLAATVSRTSNEGLFRYRAPSDVSPCLVDLRYNESYGDVFHCVEGNAWETSVNSGILNTRAWVLQEMMLASRTLHFASDQIFWRCKSLLASEIYPSGIFEEYPEYNRRLQLTTGPSVWGSHAWFDIVESYTSKLLTKESADKIVALSGIARHVAMNDGLREHDYLAGLWKHTLPLALIWRSESGGQPLQNGAPSWAWASISGNIEFPLRGFTVKNIDIIEAHTTPRADPYGQVIGGELRLSGSVVVGYLSNHEGRDRRCEDCNRDLQCQDWACAEGRHASTENPSKEHKWHFQCTALPYHCVHHVELDLDDLALRGSKQIDRIYFLLFHVDWHQIRHVDGLVLEMVSASTFRRLGYFTGGPDGLCFLHCAKSQRLGHDEIENFDGVDRYAISII